MLTFELITGASPFTVDNGKNSQSEISKRILKNDPPIPPNLSRDVKSFIAQLLVKEPRERLGGGPRDAEELKEHAFFMNAPNFNWDLLKQRKIKPPFVPYMTHELDTRNFAEEFTKQSVTDSPAVVPPNYDKIFRVSEKKKKMTRKKVLLLSIYISTETFNCFLNFFFQIHYVNVRGHCDRH